MGEIPRRRLANRLYSNAIFSWKQVLIYWHLHGLGRSLPYRTRKDQEVANFLLREITLQFGLPKSLQSDNGPSAVSRITQQLSPGFRHIISSPYQLKTLLCSLPRPGRSTLDLGTWKKMCGAVGMLDIPSFIGWWSMRAANCMLPSGKPLPAYILNTEKASREP